jgi:hypothetical protein
MLRRASLVGGRQSRLGLWPLFLQPSKPLVKASMELLPQALLLFYCKLHYLFFGAMIFQILIFQIIPLFWKELWQ